MALSSTNVIVILLAPNAVVILLSVTFSQDMGVSGKYKWAMIDDVYLK